MLSPQNGPKSADLWKSAFIGLGELGETTEIAANSADGNPVKPDRLRLTLMRSGGGTLSWKFGEAPQRKPHHETLRVIFFGPDRDRSSLFAKQLDLAEFTELRKGTISKHIKALRSEGLVTVSHEGIAVTDAGIERLEQFFPDDDFES